MESSCNTNRELTRVFIWCVPRTLGTALTKCLSYVDGIQVINEPFVSAFNFGPESLRANSGAETNTDPVKKFMDSASAVQNVFEKAFDDSKCTYGWVRQQLEAEYPGKKYLLVKDQAFCLNEKYNSIPPGFRHVFLIRHPYKVYPSWKRLLTKLFNLDHDPASLTDLEELNHQPCGMVEMQFNLLKYVQENLDPNPVIIDSDDLQNNPASTLRQFCEAVGIPYNDSLLEWPGNRDIMKTWIGSRIALQGNLLENEGGFYENALRSSSFLPSTATPNRSELSEDVLKVADDALPFYEQMYQMRLKP
ncbi:uncharacterized protein [Amphiura filiformis]|uniref:uncharacterized protein n=1 Tax=Amphiura filiformis TaxID=82378 RepID=UPI003B228035